MSTSNGGDFDSTDARRFAKLGREERGVVVCPSELAFGGAGVVVFIDSVTYVIYTFTVEDMTKQGETARDAGEKGRARAKKAKKKGGASSGPAVDL